MGILHDLQTWWLQQSLWEMIGVISGLLCVYLAAKNIIWNWPFAIVSVSIYIFIFYEKNLFADMGLQVYFLATNIYGWYFWSKAPSTENKKPVKLITKQEVMISIIATVVFTLFLGSVLKYTTASFPYLDSFCSACSLVAQVLLARKVVENWLIWVFVDTIYVGIYILKGLDATAVMYAIYIPIALLGYLDWRRDWRKQHNLISSK